MKKVRRGFTLVELIVVIGILGILMAILAVSLSGNDESARAVKCLANMRSLATAVQSCSLDSKEGDYLDRSFLPFAGSITKKDSYGKTWQVAGWISWDTTAASGSYPSPYDDNRQSRELCITNGAIYSALSGNRGAYVCPDHLRYAKEKHLPIPLWSYVMSAYFHWQSQGTPFHTHHYGRVRENVDRPERYLLFAELPFAKMENGSGDTLQEGHTSAGADEVFDPILQYENCEGGGNEAIGFNHRKKNYVYGHVCYLDGHAAQLEAPKKFSHGDAVNLTRYLCHPVDDDGNPVDISLQDGKYIVY